MRAPGMTKQWLSHSIPIIITIFTLYCGTYCKYILPTLDSIVFRQNEQCSCTSDNVNSPRHVAGVLAHIQVFASLIGTELGLKSYPRLPCLSITTVFKMNQKLAQNILVLEEGDKLFFVFPVLEFTMVGTFFFFLIYNKTYKAIFVST